MGDLEEVDVERRPSGGDCSLSTPVLTRQTVDGRNPGSGEGPDGGHEFATNGTRSGVSTGGVCELDRGDSEGYSRRRGTGDVLGT